jgi:hypothetical protein
LNHSSLVAAAIQGCAALFQAAPLLVVRGGGAMNAFSVSQRDALVLAMCGGVRYLTLLAPPLAGYLYPWYLAPDVIGEPVLMLWLLIVGLNPRRWRQQAGAPGP